MKKLFWAGTIGLIAFELLNVYLVMPMPGSQRMNSIGAAYFLYRSRWIFRILFGLLVIIPLVKANWKRKWIPAIPLVAVAACIWMFNFVMAADHMFYQPAQMLMADAAHNKIDTGRLVIGIENNGESKAYPIRLLGFHHQVQDTIGGKPVLVTYCTVCRTGRVYDPVVNGHHEIFRLVGMDHFNAMLEDHSTGSWWRQATGEAIAGPLKGQQLQELYSTQSLLSEWLHMHPQSLVMQEDPAYKNDYDTSFNYESGRSRKQLTGTDSLSWKAKSWVIGVKAGNAKKAYDWNRLVKDRIINDQLDNIPLVLVLAGDNKSFFAYERPAKNFTFLMRNDTLFCQGNQYTLGGKAIDTGADLKPLPAYQEFWHSWRTFNPGSLH